ncbi:hypothetical protein ABKW28_04970 [Nocardioides sp. 31GB23]|uniref:hypothetical protein n=1 Tax=Nocardioides sp. 31GB23 TaxID=3156065 RepID=UPI0032AEDFF6
MVAAGLEPSPARDATARRPAIPKERFDHAAARHLGDLTSACPDPNLRAARRVDPYWSEPLAGRANASVWFNRATICDELTAAEIRRVPRALTLDAAVATALFNDPGDRRWLHRLCLRGALYGWHTLTAAQAAAFTGYEAFADPTRSAIGDGFAAGAIKLGLFQGSAHVRFLREPTTTLRLVDATAERDDPNLTAIEQLNLTGYSQAASQRPGDRHNILAADLALRAAEYLDVATVLSERFCTFDLLAGTGAGLVERSGGRAGDLCLILRNGTRVAIEVVANKNGDLRKKVKEVVRLLSSAPWEQSALVFLFVIAPTNDSSVNQLRYAVYDAIADAVHEHPGTSFDRTSARVGVVMWREWFPGPHLASRDFRTLTADRLTTSTGMPGAAWEPTAFLQTHVGAEEQQRLLAVAGHAAHLAQTPYWLRDLHRGSSAAMEVLRAYTADDLPHPSPVRSNRVTNPATASVPRTARSQGAAEPAQLPRRLRGIAAAGSNAN